MGMGGKKRRKRTIRQRLYNDVSEVNDIVEGWRKDFRNINTSQRMQVQCGEGQEQNAALLQTTRGIPRVRQQLQFWIQVFTGNLRQVGLIIRSFQHTPNYIPFVSQGRVPTLACVRRARAPHHIGEVCKRPSARSDWRQLPRYPLVVHSNALRR